MSLRPRYSLLTLLLITVVVAGGIKLWRGPHRQILTMTNKEDRALLEKLGCLHPLIWDVRSQELEFSYENQGDGREYHTLIGKPQDAVCFMTTDNKNKPLLVYGDTAVNPFYQSDADRLHSWICRLPSPEVVQHINKTFEGNVCGVSSYAFAEATTFYVITKRGRLYRTHGSLAEMMTKCELIEASAISDPLVHAWFDAESQSLGMIKK